MALLDEIGVALSSAGLCSTAAGDYRLMLSWLPDSTGLQDKVVAVLETGGGAAPALRQELDTAGITVLVRGCILTQFSSAYPDAYERAQQIKLALQELVRTSSSGRYLPGIQALSDPALQGIDDLNRPMISCEYSVWRSRT